MFSCLKSGFVVIFVFELSIKWGILAWDVVSSTEQARSHYETLSTQMTSAVPHHREHMCKTEKETPTHTHIVSHGHTLQTLKHSYHVVSCLQKAHAAHFGFLDGFCSLFGGLTPSDGDQLTGCLWPAHLTPHWLSLACQTLTRLSCMCVINYLKHSES